MENIISKRLLKELFNETKEIDLVYYEEDVREITYTTYADITQGTRCYDISIYDLKDKIKKWSLSNDFEIEEHPYGSKVINLNSGWIEFNSLEKDKQKMKEEKDWYKFTHVIACGEFILRNFIKEK